MRHNFSSKLMLGLACTPLMANCEPVQLKQLRFDKATVVTECVSIALNKFLSHIKSSRDVFIYGDFNSDLEAGNVLWTSPVKVFRNLFNANPELSSDPILTDAFSLMQHPTDREKFLVLCLEQTCTLYDNSKAQGVHQAYNQISVENINRLPSFKSLVDRVTKSRHQPLVPGVQLVAIRPIHNSPLTYTVIMHEMTHVSTEQMIVKWMNINIERLKNGKRPDKLFLRYCNLSGNQWSIDNAFYQTFHEGIAYGITQKIYKALAGTFEGRAIHGNFSDFDSNYQSEFQRLTGIRPKLRAELSITEENWLKKMVEIRQQILNSTSER